MSNGRLAFIDAGKITSIFLVIMLHSCLESTYLFHQIGSFNWWSSLALYTITRISVPLFFMLSGVTTIWLHYNDADRHDQEKTLARIKSLLVPVLLWSLLYLILNHKPLTTIQLSSIILSPQGLVHLWFIYCLIGLYLISPILRALLKNNRQDLLLWFMGLWLIFSSLSVYTNIWFNAPLGEWYALFPTYQTGFVGYYALGAVLMEREPLSQKTALTLIIVGFITSFSLAVWDNLSAAPQIFNDRYLNFLSPNILLMAVGSFDIMRSIRWKRLNTLSSVSSLVIGVYFVHEAILKLLREKFSLIGDGCQALVFIPTISVATFVVCVGISFVLKYMQGKWRIFF